MASLGETFVTKSYQKKPKVVKADYGDFGTDRAFSITGKKAGKRVAAKKAHPGFAAVQKKVAAKQGISMERAGAIVAAGARKASKKAVAANPRLKRVSGVKKAAPKKGMK